MALVFRRFTYYLSSSIFSFRRILALGAFLALAILFTSLTPATLSCKEILQNTTESVEKIQTLKFHLKCNERINGKLTYTESHVKMNASPRKVYINVRGPEVLYLEGKNKGNALVNPNGFPFMNLNLDPMGNLMREGQHHTLHEVGFTYFSNIIKHSMAVSGEKFEEYFKCKGMITWNGRECYYVQAEYPYFKFSEYAVQKGETLVSIAKKLRVSEYMILEGNQPKVKNYNDVKSGQKIKVPNVYGSKLIMYIDKELLLPRVIKVYDDKGLFESYEYHSLQVNVKFNDEEFTKEYKEYGF